MRVMVIGGSGRAGSHIAHALDRAGHEVTAGSRSSGVDVLNGDKLAEALDGIDVLVDAANPDSLEYEEASKFFTAATTNLLHAERVAGVRHHITLSIVGIDRVDLGYYQAKLDQEDTVRNHAEGVPSTIVRSTQFMEFLPQVIESNIDDGVARLSPVDLQPIALEDLGALVADVVYAEPTADHREIAGPQPIALDDLATQLFAARGKNIAVSSSVDHRPFFGSDIPERALLPGAHARLGQTTVEQWLQTI